MTHLNQNQSTNLTEQILRGCLAVDTSLETVKSLFHAREIYEIYYLKENKKEISLEVEFGSSTLLCLFDDDHICESVFLLPDDLVDIIQCIEYCNKAYPYDRTLKGWITYNRIIQINTCNNECSLSILPIKPTKGS